MIEGCQAERSTQADEHDNPGGWVPAGVFRSYLGEDVPAEGEEGFAEGTVRTLMRSLSPSGD